MYGLAFFCLGAVSELYQAISILFQYTSPETPDLGVVSSAGRATRLHRVGRGFEPSPPTIWPNALMCSYFPNIAAATAYIAGMSEQA